MLTTLKKLFDFNAKLIDGHRKTLQRIQQHEEELKDKKDDFFATETARLKDSIGKGETTLNDELPYAFALVREASFRILGMRHFDEQLIAGMVLHQGNIAEQKTGEGKTLSATAPLYLNALTGKGVHLVTVNDYLARRDAGWMAEVFSFLGLSVSAIISEKSFIFDPSYQDPQASDWRFVHLRPCTRKEAYQADITYGINSEFGFDYLRDNMAKSPEQRVQRGFHFAIIDEVDSVLIDEARTPHIISASYDQDVSRYYEYARLVHRLVESDYVIDEKQKTAHINEVGIEKLEKMLGVENIYEKDYETLFHVEAALKARALFTKDKDYIVRDGEVIIVDEFTGRLLEGRRYSEGLHQAIEAKEGVEIKRESRTLATVSLQNYFRMYEKLAGMTGTAQTEAEEFNKIYKLDTVVIPTHRPISRRDHPDYIYKTEQGKLSAVANMVAELHSQGRPVLIGTSSIDKNELLARLLKKRGIPHEVLNAKNHEREAQIISKAGMKGAVTVATNMAGRGVDIELGGVAPNRFSIDPALTQTEQNAQYAKLKKEWQRLHDEVVELGGLYVISTERHESRRIDNQLRGRAGRQGDPGDTRFYVSLEDDLMRIFGGEQVSKVMNMFQMPEDQPIEHALISRAMEQAQSKVEGFNFDTRKHLVEYDDVLNKQREILYKLRSSILITSHNDPTHLREEFERACRDQIGMVLNMHMSVSDEPQYELIAQELDPLLPGNTQDIVDRIRNTIGVDEIIAMLVKLCMSHYDEMMKELGEQVWSSAVYSLFLDTIDSFWTEHLTSIDDLRSGIGLRGYAQLDPLTEYKNEAFSMFEKLLSNINYEIVRRVIQMEPAQLSSLQEAIAQLNVTEMKLNTDDHQTALDRVKAIESPQKKSSQASRQPAKPKKPGRNDPCWCGSGKKYKKCHYPD